MFLFLQKIFHEMSRWVIYDKSGGVRAVSDGLGAAGNWTLPELEYNGEWMGEAFVTLTVRCAVPIEFEICDYVLYRGEKFVMNYDPTVVKKARRGTHGEGFVYENVKFNSLGSELSDARMLDYVIDDNLIHYSGLPKFSFFCKDVDDLADRLQVNMNRYCDLNGFAKNDYWLFLTPSTDGQGNPVRTLQRAASCGMDAGVALARWTAVYGGTADGRRVAYQSERVNQNVSVENQSVWECCKNVKDVFGLNFIVRGRDLCIGTAGLPTTDIFRYGKGKGLYEIERTADSEQAIVTKLFAYGSSKNLPTRYYANLNAVCFLTITGVEENGNDGTQDNYLLSYVGDADVYGMFRNRTSTDNGFYCTVGVRLSVTGDVTETLLSYNTRRSVGLSIPCVTWQGYERGEGLPVGTQVYFYSGIDKDKWPAGNTDYSTENLPNNMALDVLMLPGFPNQSLYDWVLANGGTALSGGDDNVGHAEWRGHRAYFSRDKYQPYILSENYLVLGIREAAKYFDGSDGEDEIFPTIENTGKDAVVSAERIQDNGVFGEGDIPNFKIRLPDFGSGFDLKALLQSDTAIEMKDGYCGGRSFAVVGAKKVDGVWECECKRSPDDALDLYFPYQHGTTGDAYQVLAGDKYVLTGIEMTDTYVEEAAKVLLEASLVFLDANDYTRHTYVPRVDEIYMARQHDAAVASRGGSAPLRSYYETLKEGDVMLFEDADLGIDGSVFIDTLRIKEYGNGQIPTYEVTLRNDKQVGTIQRIQEKINSLTSTGGGGGGGGVNVPQIRSLIGTYGRELFLSKKEADTASGVISFLKGALFGANGAFGWVKSAAEWMGQSFTNGVAWFRNLLADYIGTEYLKSGIVEITDYLKGRSDNTYGSVLKILSRVEIPQHDVAIGDANNRKGITVTGDVRGDKGFFNNLDVGNAITTKNLTVTGLAHFFELVIDRIRSAGGAQIYTPADGFSVEAVNRFEYDGSVRRRLWWRATDGDRMTQNMWKSGDQAICMNFNTVRDSGTYSSISNKTFWAVVAWADSTSANSTPTWDATNPAYVSGAPNPYEVTKWHYIDIITGDEGDEPTKDAQGRPHWTGTPWAVAAGDDVAMLGYRGNDDDMVARQSAVYLSAYNSLDKGDVQLGIRGLEAPFLAFYRGINDFNLAAHRQTFMDAVGSVFMGDFKIDTDTDLDTYINNYIDEHFDVDADFYRLRPMVEDALVDAAKTLRVTLKYGLEHVVNGSVTLVNSSAWDGYSLAVSADQSRAGVPIDVTNEGSLKKVVYTVGNYDEADDVTLFTIQLKKGANIIEQRLARVGMKSGTIFEVTDAGLRLAMQEINDGIVGRNLLWNSEFVNVTNHLPEYWSVWNGNGVPSVREIVTVDGYVCMHVRPTNIWQGYCQISSTKYGWTWRKELVHGKKYTLSFYAKGTGVIGGSVEPVDVSSGQSITYYGFNGRELTTAWKRYSYTFTVSPSSSVSDGYGFVTYLGFFDTLESYAGQDAYITMPKLEEGDKATRWLTSDEEDAMKLVVLRGEIAATAAGLRTEFSEGISDAEGRITEAYHSEITQTARELRSEISALPISRNLLLNAAFVDVDDSTLLPDKWMEWNDSEHDFERQIAHVSGEIWQEARLRPTEQHQGYMQPSSNITGGVWKKILRHNTKYTLSFYARGNGRADCIVHLFKIGSDGSAEFIPNTWIGDEFALGSGWQRYSITFNALPGNSGYYDADGYGFNVMFGCYHATPPSDERIIVSRPQLEEGETATEWRRGEENSEIMSSQIKQTADEVSLAVKVDGVKRAGVTLDSNGVTIDGDKLHFNGTINDEVTIEGANLHILNDIDLQGLTTENVTTIERSFSYEGEYRPLYPHAINMGVGKSQEIYSIKSVQMAKLNLASEDFTQPANHDMCPMVVLPFYDSYFEHWKGQMSHINFNVDSSSALYGSFPLWTKTFGNDVELKMRKSVANGYEEVTLLGTISEELRRSVAWRRNGTRVTITNEYDEAVRNWKYIEGQTWEATSKNIVGHLIPRGILVCSDGRIVCEANASRSDGYVGRASGSVNVEDYAGRFSCGGYVARFILVLPGQSLQLRSHITKISDNQEVLIWVVENASDFVPLKQFPLNFKSLTYTAGDGAVFGPMVTTSGENEVILGHSAINACQFGGLTYNTGIYET